MHRRWIGTLLDGDKLTQRGPFLQEKVNWYIQKIGGGRGERTKGCFKSKCTMKGTEEYGPCSLLQSFFETFKFWNCQRLPSSTVFKITAGRFTNANSELEMIVSAYMLYLTQPCLWDVYYFSHCLLMFIDV